MKYGIRWGLEGWFVYEVAANKIVSGPHYFKWVAVSKRDALNERGV